MQKKENHWFFLNFKLSIKYNMKVNLVNKFMKINQYNFNSVEVYLK